MDNSSRSASISVNKAFVADIESDDEAASRYGMTSSDYKKLKKRYKGLLLEIKELYKNKFSYNPKTYTGTLTQPLAENLFYKCEKLSDCSFKVEDIDRNGIPEFIIFHNVKSENPYSKILQMYKIHDQDNIHWYGFNIIKDDIVVRNGANSFIWINTEKESNFSYERLLKIKFIPKDPFMEIIDTHIKVCFNNANNKCEYYYGKGNLTNASSKEKIYEQDYDKYYNSIFNNNQDEKLWLMEGFPMED